MPALLTLDNVVGFPGLFLRTTCGGLCLVFWVLGFFVLFFSREYSRL